MSYVELLNQYRKKNYYEYPNHEAMYEQVRAAMSKTGEERSEALRDVLKNNYMKDAEQYEPMRKKLVHDMWATDKKEYREASNKTKTMAGSAGFLVEYVALIDAMAKDVDSGYEPEFMLGMSVNDAKNYVSQHLSTYSIYDQHRYALSKDDWRTRYENLNDAIMEDGEYFNYEDSPTYAKENMKEVYMRKEIIKEDLKKMGFFSRYFSAEGREMRKYVKTVENALKTAGFTEEAAKEAMYDSSRSASLENEYEGCHVYLDLKYKAHVDGRDAEFEKEFRKRNINDDTVDELEDSKEVVQFKQGELDPASKNNDVSQKHDEPVIKNDSVKKIG